MSMRLGEPAPHFSLSDHQGDIVRLADFQGKYVVLYFYPKDLTPACTNQACDFRDRYGQFSQSNVIIIGISTDPIKKHAKFKAQYELPFVLLSDEDHAVSSLYDVWKKKSMYGREFMGIERSSFLIGPDGALLMEWRKIRVAGHVENILKYIESIK